MVALACPSIVWTTFTSAPDAIASDAAVCRKPCGVNTVGPVASTAGMNTARPCRRCVATCARPNNGEATEMVTSPIGQRAAALVGQR